MSKFACCALTSAFACLLVLSSCSTYQGDFAQAVADAEVPPNSPQGPWQGRWKSNQNGHEGPLWCIISPVADQPGSYQFRYRAGWGRLQFGDYATVVKPANPGSPWTVQDSLELPGGFGTYSIKGTVTNREFSATFTSDGGDHGTMTLERPK